MARMLRCGVSPSFSSKVSARLGQTISCSFNATVEEKHGDTSYGLIGVSLAFDHIWTEQGKQQVFELLGWNIFIQKQSQYIYLISACDN